MTRFRKALPWFLVGIILVMIGCCISGGSTISLPTLLGNLGSGGSFDSGSDSGSWDWGSGSDSGSWDWGSGSDSGSWDWDSGSDSGSWDFGGSDSGSWDSGGSDSGSW